MTQYVYHPEGHAQGVVLGKYVYDLSGHPVGRITGTRIYRLDGTYAGELFQDMVVEKPVGARLPLPPISNPESVVPPLSTVSRKPMAYDFPDAFHLLAETAPRSLLSA